MRDTTAREAIRKVNLFVYGWNNDGLNPGYHLELQTPLEWTHGSKQPSLLMTYNVNAGHGFYSRYVLNDPLLGYLGNSIDRDSWMPQLLGIAGHMVNDIKELEGADSH